MDINPMMLLPLLMGNKENGEKGNDDMQKMLSLITSLQSGKPEALLDMLGGDNEKIKNILSIMKTMPGSQPVGGASQPHEDDKSPFRAAPSGINNDEITRALNVLMSSKKDK